ncbi:hypothetical protein MHU86_2916 [Fragilaria crotonensis]|nr:hypothetical protein MHU86_2916 [Fragilaria crotonensis]
MTISDERYSYNETDRGIYSIKQCVTDLKTTVQKCWLNEKVRASCTCSTVTTIQWAASNTTIRFLGGYGIEFDLDNEKQTYGSSYNLVKEPLYSKLANSASAVVIDFDVVAGETTHDTHGFANLLKFIQQWSLQQMVVYRLTMPQHFLPTSQRPPTLTNQSSDGRAWQPQLNGTGQMHWH